MSNNNNDHINDESANTDQTTEYNDEILNLIEESDAAQKKRGILDPNNHSWKNVAFLLMLFDIMAVNVPPRQGSAIPSTIRMSIWNPTSSAFIIFWRPAVTIP